MVVVEESAKACLPPGQGRVEEMKKKKEEEEEVLSQGRKPRRHRDTQRGRTKASRGSLCMGHWPLYRGHLLEEVLGAETFGSGLESH